MPKLRILPVPISRKTQVRTRPVNCTLLIQKHFTLLARQEQLEIISETDTLSIASIGRNDKSVRSPLIVKDHLDLGSQRETALDSCRAIFQIMQRGPGHRIRKQLIVMLSGFMLHSYRRVTSLILIKLADEGCKLPYGYRVVQNQPSCVHRIYEPVQQDRPRVGSSKPALLSSFVWIDISLGIITVHDVVIE